MRLALLSHMASPAAPTGAERSLFLLARGLVQRGHEVAVALPGPWVLGEELDRLGIARIAIPCRSCWLVAQGRQPLFRLALRALRYALPDPGRAGLTRWLSVCTPDVVHVNCLPHVRGAAAAHAAHIPVVWHLREILPPGPRRRWFARRLARYADCIVAVSEAVAEWVREEGLGDRVEVVYNGVAVAPPVSTAAAARRALGLPRDGCLVGFFSQLVANKGALEFVQAARSALAKQSGLRFVLAGDGPASYLAQIKEAIASGPRPEVFHLLEPQAEIGPLLAALDVVALTTLTPDPLPRTVMEAMAAAKPVVAFSGGGVAEMVLDGETGFLSAPGDCEAFAESLVRLAADPELVRKQGQAGARRAQEFFSLDRHVDKMERLLKWVRGE